MGAKRHQRMEYALLSLTLRQSDHLGYSNTLPGLVSILRQTLVDIENREVVDTLKNLCGNAKGCEFHSPGANFVRCPQTTCANL